MKYKSGILLQYSNGSHCLFDRKKFFKSYVYLKCAKYQSFFPKILIYMIIDVLTFLNGIHLMLSKIVFKKK